MSTYLLPIRLPGFGRRSTQQNIKIEKMNVPFVHRANVTIPGQAALRTRLHRKRSQRVNGSANLQIFPAGLGQNSIALHGEFTLSLRETPICIELLIS